MRSIISSLYAVTQTSREVFTDLKIGSRFAMALKCASSSISLKKKELSHVGNLLCVNVLNDDPKLEESCCLRIYTSIVIALT